MAEIYLHEKMIFFTKRVIPIEGFVIRDYLEFPGEHLSSVEEYYRIFSRGKLIRYAIWYLWFLRQRVVEIQQPSCSIEIHNYYKDDYKYKDIGFEKDFELVPYFKMRNLNWWFRWLQQICWNAYYWKLSTRLDPD